MINMIFPSALHAYVSVVTLILVQSKSSLTSTNPREKRQFSFQGAGGGQFLGMQNGLGGISLGDLQNQLAGGRLGGVQSLGRLPQGGVGGVAPQGGLNVPEGMLQSLILPAGATQTLGPDTQSLVGEGCSANDNCVTVQGLCGPNSDPSKRTMKQGVRSENVCQCPPNLYVAYSVQLRGLICRTAEDIRANQVKGPNPKTVPGTVGTRSGLTGGLTSASLGGAPFSTLGKIGNQGSNNGNQGGLVNLGTGGLGALRGLGGGLQGLTGGLQGLGGLSGLGGGLSGGLGGLGQGVNLGAIMGQMGGSQPLTLGGLGAFGGLNGLGGLGRIGRMGGMGGVQLGKK